MTTESLKPWADMINTLLAQEPVNDIEVAITILHDLAPLLAAQNTGETIGTWVVENTNLTTAISARVINQYCNLTMAETDKIMAERGGVQ